MSCFGRPSRHTIKKAYMCLIQINHKSYHFLSSDSDRLGVFHHAGLVIHERSLRFRWRALVQLRKGTHKTKEMTLQLHFSHD